MTRKVDHAGIGDTLSVGACASASNDCSESICPSDMSGIEHLESSKVLPSDTLCIGSDNSEEDAPPCSSSMDSGMASPSTEARSFASSSHMEFRESKSVSDAVPHCQQQIASESSSSSDGGNHFQNLKDFMDDLSVGSGHVNELDSHETQTNSQSEEETLCFPQLAVTESDDAQGAEVDGCVDVKMRRVALKHGKTV